MNIVLKTLVSSINRTFPDAKEMDTLLQKYFPDNRRESKLLAIIYQSGCVKQIVEGDYNPDSINEAVDTIAYDNFLDTKAVQEALQIWLDAYSHEKTAAELAKELEEAKRELERMRQELSAKDRELSSVKSTLSAEAPVQPAAVPAEPKKTAPTPAAAASPKNENDIVSDIISCVENVQLQLSDNYNVQKKVVNNAPDNDGIMFKLSEKFFNRTIIIGVEKITFMDDSGKTSNLKYTDIKKIITNHMGIMLNPVLPRERMLFAMGSHSETPYWKDIPMKKQNIGIGARGGTISKIIGNIIGSIVTMYRSQPIVEHADV